MQQNQIISQEEWLATKGVCSVRVVTSSVKNGGVRGAERLRRQLARNWQRPQRSRIEKGQELTGRDLAEIVELLECKLAWFGFRSVKVGPFIRVKDSTVSIDLLDRDELFCRIELDRCSGAIRPSSRDALRPSMTSLRMEGQSTG